MTIAEVVTEATREWGNRSDGPDLMSTVARFQREADANLVREQAGILAVFITSGRAENAKPDELAHAITQHLASKIENQPMTKQDQADLRAPIMKEKMLSEMVWQRMIVHTKKEMIYLNGSVDIGMRLLSLRRALPEETKHDH